MVLGPTSSAPVAVAWFGCLFAGGFWHARKEIPSDLPANTSSSPLPVAAPENARFAIEKPVINEQQVKEILEKSAISEQEEKVEKPVINEHGVESVLEKPGINEQNVEEVIEQPALSKQEDSDSFSTAALFESKINMIQSKSLELLDEVIQNCSDEKQGTPSQLTIPEYDFASFSIEDITQLVMNTIDNNDFHANVIKILSSDSSPLVWAIVASWPIDLLLIFCMCGCCRKTKASDCDIAATTSDCGKNSNENIVVESKVIEGTTEKSKVTLGLSDTDAPSQDELLKGSEMVAHEELFQGSDVVVHEEVPEEVLWPSTEVEASAETVQRTKRKSQQDLKALMERRRAECEVVENTQTLVSTDAKAPEQPKFKWHSSCESEDQSNGQTRAQRTSRPSRNSSDLKALMEKKRDQCQVVESAQEHVETDAKASCHDAVDVVG